MYKQLHCLILLLIGSVCGAPLFAQSNRDLMNPGNDSSINIISDSVNNSSKDSLLILKSVSANKDPLHPKHSYFQAGMEYLSNNVYLGRKDTTVLPYFTTTVGYYNKSGLFAAASLSYLKNSTESRLDLITMEAGYMLNAGHYEAQLTVSKFFYNSQSTNVSSSITASVALDNHYDLGPVTLAISGTINMSLKNDFAGQFGLEHTFYLLNDHLDFAPTFTVNASTQNYYNDYYLQRKYSIKRKGQVTQTGIATITGTVLNASTFKILDYEPSLPVNYTIGKWTIHFTPTYSIPVNPAAVDIHTVRDNGQVLNKTKTEQLENSFYWTLGVSITF